MWVLIWALVVGSALAVYYYLKVILAMARSPETTADDQPKTALDGMAALAVVGVSLVSFGVFPSPLIEMVRGVLGATGN